MKENFKEQSTHGSALFPLHIYNHLDLNGTYTVNAHWHYEFELIYLEYGKMLAHIDGQKIHLQPGDCLCVHPSEIHSLTGTSATESRHFAIVFSTQFFESAVADEIQLSYIEPLKKGQLRLPRYIPASVSTASNTQILKNIIMNYYNQEFGSKLLLKSFFYQFLATTLITPPTDAKPLATAIHIEYVKKSIDYIQQNYDKKIYLQDLADLTNTSPHYLGKVFKKTTGKTPFDYIKQYRIERASKLLLTTNDSVLSIAFDVGFDNVSYFIRTFQAFYGITPAKYRKKTFEL